MFNKRSKVPNQISLEHENFIKKVKRRRRTILVTQVLILIFSLALWEMAAKLEWIDAFLTSHPSAIIKLFARYLENGEIFRHIGISVVETVIGFIAGTILGIIIAVLLWWSDFVAKVLDPYMVVLNSLPKTALAPIIILWVGAGFSGIIVTAITLSIVISYYSIISFPLSYLLIWMHTKSFIKSLNVSLQKNIIRSKMARYKLVLLLLI